MPERVPIILTKLHPPLLRPHTFARQRLVEVARQAVERRLTLICAAPGYGKTTLMASAFSGAGLPLAWYSLSRSDRDPVTFCSYLVEGFDRAQPGRGFAEGVRAAVALGQGAQPHPTAFVAACVNQLAASGCDEFLVVLDDFQLVDQIPAIAQVIDQFLLYAPPQAHFVIASRATPPFTCLPRLRAESQVLELGEADLRFTPEEAGCLFSDTLRLHLPEARLASLVEQTEGWTLGLLLAGQSIRGGSQVEVSHPRPGASPDRRVLFEYLTEEILRQQPGPVVDFLTASAVLSRLNPAVCDAALGRTDSALRLRDLEQRCLFVVRTEDGWLRYHRLFREFLLQHLADDPERLEVLNRRAAAFFQEQHNYETAIFHWLEARAYHSAAQLIAAEAGDTLRTGRFDTLHFWLSQLPENEYAEFPELWVRQGQLCEAGSQWDQALESYDRGADAFRARGDLLGLSDVLQRKGQLLDWRKGHYTEAERLHREALSYVGEAHHSKRAALLANLARTQLSAGNTAAAKTLYQEALGIYEAEADRQGQLDTLLNAGAWLYHSLGEFSAALAVLRRCEQLARELGHGRALAEAHNNLAVNLYYLGRWREALVHAEQALALSRELGDAHAEAYALMNQAASLEATCGASYDDLFAQFQHVLAIEQGLHNQRFVIATLVFMSVLARRGGHLAEAARRARQALMLARERSLRWLEAFALTQLGAAQIWIDPVAAQASLEEAAQTASDCEDAYHITAGYFWLAVLFHAEGNPTSLMPLRECLRLAVSHHYDFFFASEAQAAIPLLVMALEHDLWSAYVAPILVGLGARAAGSLRPLLAHDDPAVRQRAQAVLEEMGQPVPARPAGAAASGAAAAPRPAGVPPLSIQCFGRFTVARGGRPIEEREWGRRKCKRLLKYLVLSPDQSMPKDAAVDLLWAEADPQAANANFYRTLYHLRRVLQPQSPHSGADYVTLEAGLLRLMPNAVQGIDVVEFTRAVEAGRRLAASGNAVLAIERLSAAVQLYRDDLATDDVYDDWVQPHRDHLRATYLAVLRELASLAANAGQPELALTCLRQAFEKDPASEAACLILMQALAAAGRRNDALQAYAACEASLAELGLTPPEQLRALRQQLLGPAGGGVAGRSTATPHRSRA